ncbi:MAG TPA: MFS transporter [Gammaproteobacteria bacterium]|jgi:MFS family permease|nr:MFS transporter [Gammaproteobacteria bacterium]
MALFLDFSIFQRNRQFTFLYIGQFVSFIGTMITGVALPYQIYSLTHSTLMVGLLSLFQLLPLLFTALVGGVFADRYHRRLLLLSAEAMLALGSFLLAMNAYSEAPHIWAIFLIATIMSAFNGLHRPALESIVQQIVRKEDFPALGSFAMLKANASMIGGPALGGLLIANFGVVATYLVDVASFAISLGALLCMGSTPKPIAQRDESTWAALRQGCRYAWSRQELMGSYTVDFLAMVFGMPSALFPAMAVSFGGAQTLGILYAAPAVGALLLSFVSGWAKKVRRHGRAIALSAIFWGVAIILFGLAKDFWVAIFFLALAGAFDGMSGIFRTIMWNETIPNHLRGRLAGIEMISYLSGPKLGDTEAGLVAALFGVTTSIVTGGVLCVVGVLAACYVLPQFWYYHADRYRA